MEHDYQFTWEAETRDYVSSCSCGKEYARSQLESVFLAQTLPSELWVLGFDQHYMHIIREVHGL